MMNDGDDDDDSDDGGGDIPLVCTPAWSHLSEFVFVSFYFYFLNI
jgi:hypothetical protein